MTAQTPPTASSACFAVGQPLYPDSVMVASRPDRTDEVAEVTAAHRRVLDQVLETMPLDLASARSQSVGWHTKPAATIGLLCDTRTLIRRVQPAANYLTGTDREIFDEWLSLIPQLP